MGIGGGAASGGGDEPTANFRGQSTSYYVPTTQQIGNKIYNQLIGTPIHERDVTGRVNCGKWPAGLSLLLLWSPTGSVIRYFIIDIYYYYIYIYIYIYICGLIVSTDIHVRRTIIIN